MRRLLLLAPVLLPPQLGAQAPAPAFETTGTFFALSVNDLLASREWYEQKLGLRVTFEPAPVQGFTPVILEGGGLIVELMHNAAAQARPVPPTNPAGIHGIFKVGIIVEDYERTLATLRERAVPTVMGPFPARDGQRANFIVADNSGNLIQFFGPDPRVGAEGEVRALWRQFEGAFNRNDAATIGRLFTNSADRVNNDGEWVRGGRAIQQSYAQMLARRANDASAEAFRPVISIRMLREDVALVDGEWKGKRAGKDHGGRFVMIAKKTAGTWLFDAGRAWDYPL
jgi:uncharacterized protein (TIGR02246 family)